MRRRRKLLFAGFALLLALLLAELGAKAWLCLLASEQGFQRYASITQLRARYGAFDRFQTHRHLGYALAPGYEKGPNRHDSRGFRGEEFAVEKAPGTTRIVCCGGSTTYGEGVLDYRSSMPFLLGLGLGIEHKPAEVVNAPLGSPGSGIARCVKPVRLMYRDFAAEQRQDSGHADHLAARNDITTAS